jgi:hypothetical protein
MKNIGGEMEFKTDIFEALTDSGRSSLRLALKSLPSKKIKFLLPDFLCGIIPDVFDETGLEYSFYKIKSDLSIDWESVKKENYDAFYAINYFGQRHDLKNIPSDKLLVEDCAFLPVLSKPEFLQNWISFNSFRKISNAPDGSVVRSTIPIDKNLKSNDPAAFSALKAKAGKIKSEFINEGLCQEKDYLELFEKGEKAIDLQSDIYSISESAALRILDLMETLESEKNARMKNYKALDAFLSGKSISIKTDFYTFYVLLAEKRDELRNFLFGEKIFFVSVNFHVEDGLKKTISFPSVFKDASFSE